MHTNYKQIFLPRPRFTPPYSRRCLIARFLFHLNRSMVLLRHRDLCLFFSSLSVNVSKLIWLSSVVVQRHSIAWDSCITLVTAWEEWYSLQSSSGKWRSKIAPKHWIPRSVGLASMKSAKLGDRELSDSNYFWTTDEATLVVGASIRSRKTVWGAWRIMGTELLQHKRKIRRADGHWQISLEERHKKTSAMCLDQYIPQV